MFTRSGSTWTQQGEKLTGTRRDRRQANSATSVALSADGNTALIGGPEDDSATGAAWVFTRSGGAWTQQGAKLTGGEEDGHGRVRRRASRSPPTATRRWSAAGHDDGTKSARRGCSRARAAAWSQQGPKLTGGGETGEGGFGTSVALSADGNTALIGAPGDNNGMGAAWVFTRSGSTWTQQGGKLTGGEQERRRLVRLQRRALRRTATPR